MIKKVIGIATILLVILGVGIVLTKASPRLGRDEVDNSRVEFASNKVTGLGVEDYRLGFVEGVDHLVKVDLQNVRVLNGRVYEDVGGEMPDRLVGNEANTLRRVVDDNLLALLSAPDLSDNFNNLRNPGDGTTHLNKYYLAVDNLRACVPYQLDNVLSALRPDDLQKLPVFGRVEVLKELKVDDALAALTLPSFEVPSVEVLRHQEVVDANRVVQKDTVNVAGKLGELDLAVV